MRHLGNLFPVSLRCGAHQFLHIQRNGLNKQLDHFFDDELVSASRGVQEERLHKIEPFPTKELVGYNAGFLSGWGVERYQIDLISAAKEARQEMKDLSGQTLAPVLDVDGEILADFDTNQLASFWKKIS